MPKNVQAIICTSTWKHEFCVLDDNVDEDRRVEEESSSMLYLITLERKLMNIKRRNDDGADG